jgi:hypothetical protein
MPYDYHHSATRPQRLAKGLDRCPSAHPEINLKDLVQGGKIRDPRNPSNILASAPFGSISHPLPLFIFAVDEAFNMRIYPDGDRAQIDSVKHESLFHNAVVLAAGEIHIHDGEVQDINDKSGSYSTYGELSVNPEFAQAVREALLAANAPFTDAVHRLLLPRTT